VSILLKKGEYTVGIGCRKGVGSAEVIEAVRAAFAENEISEADVLVYATTTKKDMVAWGFYKQ
jgi:cobalt-precorrin 5A hydrolase